MKKYNDKSVNAPVHVPLPAPAAPIEVDLVGVAIIAQHSVVIPVPPRAPGPGSRMSAPESPVLPCALDLENPVRFAVDSECRRLTSAVRRRLYKDRSTDELGHRASPQMSENRYNRDRLGDYRGEDVWTMGVRFISRSEHKVSTWTGGQTTELAIFPPGSSYAHRTFGWRVSSATVAVPVSEFTRLEGYRRHLMVLDGELRLRPATGAELELAPGDQYHFDGATPITSFGLATDFNLMLAAGWRGRLTRLVVAPAGRGR